MELWHRALHPRGRLTWPAAWFLLVSFLLLRFACGGDPARILTGSLAAWILVLAAVRALWRSFERANQGLDSGAGNAASERLQGRALLAVCPALALVVMVLGWGEHPLWWWVLGPLVLLLAAGALAPLLSQRQWDLWVFTPICLAAIAALLWALLWALDRLLTQDLRPYGWPVAVATGLIGCLAVWKILRDAR